MNENNVEQSSYLYRGEFLKTGAPLDRFFFQHWNLPSSLLLLQFYFQT